MVIESSFINVENVERKPWEMFFIGFLYATAAVFLSIWIFKQYSSLIMVFLTVLASVPLMYNMLKHEEEFDITAKGSEGSLLKHHIKALDFLLFMFLGFLVAYSIWFIALPSSLVQTLFSSQLDTISSINTQISGNAVSSNITFQILFNNLKVLFFSIFFAFFYGAGAIFILTWNASVISAAIGVLIKNNIADYAASIGSVNAFNYFHIFSVSLLRFAIHGIPEIAAYFIGGIAGGIISVSIINHHLESMKFKKIIFDVLNLIILAVIILIIAALIEVFITPTLF